MVCERCEGFVCFPVEIMVVGLREDEIHATGVEKQDLRHDIALMKNKKEICYDVKDMLEKLREEERKATGFEKEERQRIIRLVESLSATSRLLQKDVNGGGFFVRRRVGVLTDVIPAGDSK